MPKISAWVASLKAVEADIMIQMATELPLTNLDEVDISKFEQMQETD